MGRDREEEEGGRGGEGGGRRRRNLKDKITVREEMSRLEAQRN